MNDRITCRDFTRLDNDPLCGIGPVHTSTLNAIDALTELTDTTTDQIVNAAIASLLVKLDLQNRMVA